VRVEAIVLRVLAGVGLGAVLTVGAAVPAAAQNPLGRAVVGVGGSFLTSDGDTAFGFMVDAAKNFAVGEHVGLGPAGDFAFHRYEDFTITSFLGGGRLTLGNREAQVFGQFLVGYEHCCGFNDFAYQPGVGLDIRLTDFVNLRGQFDLRVVRIDGADGKVDFRETRFSVGVSLPFGK